MLVKNDHFLRNFFSSKNLHFGITTLFLPLVVHTIFTKKNPKKKKKISLCTFNGQQQNFTFFFFKLELTQIKSSSNGSFSLPHELAAHQPSSSVY